MFGIQFLVIAIVAAVVAVPIVLFIPRARHSPVFDKVLWVATWLLGFLGGWYAIGNANDWSMTFKTLVLADVPVLVVLIGASVGALSLNLVLWLLDRFAPPEMEELFEEDASEVNDEQQQSES